MNAKVILEHLDSIEVIAIELLTKLVAWVSPIVTAILIIVSLTPPPLNYPLWLAIPYGFVIEALGIAFVSTMVYFFSEWWGRLPAVGAFVVSAVCVVSYAVVAFPVVTVIKGYPEYGWVVPAGGVLLSLLSGIIVGIRANWQKYQLVASDKNERQTQRAAGNIAQFSDKGNKAKTDKATQRKLKAIELAQRGYDNPAIAEEIGVSVRTVERYLNGQGST